MAQITDASMREIITQRLGAVHVEVADMSGNVLSLSASCHDSMMRTKPFPKPFPHHRFSHTTNRFLSLSLTRISTGGCGQAFTSLIVSPQFHGLTSLKRHRLVNAALRDEIAAIHAWTAKCQTPEEWERARATAAPPTLGTVGGQVEGTAQ
ncbi:BolA domain protein [Cordyceps fumosorosea ARSEF 2679]|uniref:BolA domain protein n=1 Tax=Cordyceps fumosorosea (strain ARSEF 2679) TaxID=1081104 RepID=A0A162IEM0_CORFA|nr:BolA domain protein [Cordyceps fumosorosea ARSEF 2679]OAA56055.1 BolA domain protein [Cordyceps fumosorosea ARSEF 2679]